MSNSKQTYFRTETSAGWSHFTAASRSAAKAIALAENPTGYLLLTENEGDPSAPTVGKQVDRAIINRQPATSLGNSQPIETRKKMPAGVQAKLAARREKGRE
jgi:hypothetical protein